MKISLRRALELAVGPANVDAAGHAVADWFDGRNCSGAADLIREQLQDQPAPDAVPHNRPDTSLRAELLAELASQQEVVSSLREQVERLERRWAKETAGPAVPEDMEPAAVVGEPSDDELLATLSQAVADFPPRHPEAEALCAVEYEVELELRKARAVWNRARQASQPAPPVEGEVGELVAALRADAECIEAGSHDLCSITAEQLARAAELLQQRHPEPVPVSERLPGAEDCDEDGRCWLFSKVEKEWRLLDVGNPGVPHLKYCFSHSLPATALPLPAGEGEE